MARIFFRGGPAKFAPGSSLYRGEESGSDSSTPRPLRQLIQDGSSTPSSADVLRIFFLLSKALNADVALQILQLSSFAQLRAEISLGEDPVQVGQNEKGQLVLRTEPIRVSSKGSHHSIKRINVSVTGHDQGWATVVGSWTWYDLNLVSPTKSQETAFSSENCKKSIEVGRNLRANIADQTHTMTISSTPPSGDQTFIDAIQNGDMLEIRACAIYGSWKNFVQAASVTVDYAIC